MADNAMMPSDGDLLRHLYGWSGSRGRGMSRVSNAVRGSYLKIAAAHS